MCLPHSDGMKGCLTAQRGPFGDCGSWPNGGENQAPGWDKLNVKNMIVSIRLWGKEIILVKD